MKSLSSDQFQQHQVRVPSDSVQNFVLAAGVAKSYTVPADADYVIFSSDQHLWVRSNAAAAVPAVDVTDGTGSEQNPSALAVVPAEYLSLVSDSVCTGSLSFYKAG